MITPRRATPSGFTLLEVLLASAIAVLLLGALYVAFDLVLRQTDAGREAVSQGDLGRAIVNRMTIDLSGCLGPMPPKSGGEVGSATTADSETLISSSSTSSSSSVTGLTTSGTAGTVTSTTTTTTTTTTTSTAGGTSTSGSSSSSTNSSVPDVPFAGGVVGSAQQVTLFLSRVPPTLSNRETIAAGTDQPPADLLRVTYYMSSTGRGLCRQVRPWVTADGVRNGTDPDTGAEDADMLAEEVTDIQFEYLTYDGTSFSWTDTCDGTQFTTDGQTLQGPPRAIRVTLTLQMNTSGDTKQIQHVFPIRAAPGLYTPPTPSSSSSGSSTGGGSSGSGTTGGM